MLESFVAFTGFLTFIGLNLLLGLFFTQNSVNINTVLSQVFGGTGS